MRWGTGGDWFLIVRSVLRGFVDFGEFGVDHLFLRAAVARGFAFRSCGRGIRLFLLVDRLAHLHRALRQVFGLGVDVGGVIALERGLERGDLLNAASYVQLLVFCCLGLEGRYLDATTMFWSSMY